MELLKDKFFALLDLKITSDPNEKNIYELPEVIEVFDMFNKNDFDNKEKYFNELYQSVHFANEMITKERNIVNQNIDNRLLEIKNVFDKKSNEVEEILKNNVRHIEMCMSEIRENEYGKILSDNKIININNDLFINVNASQYCFMGYMESYKFELVLKNSIVIKVNITNEIMKYKELFSSKFNYDTFSKMRDEVIDGVLDNHPNNKLTCCYVVDDINKLYLKRLMLASNIKYKVYFIPAYDYRFQIIILHLYCMGVDVSRIRSKNQYEKEVPLITRQYLSYLDNWSRAKNKKSLTSYMNDIYQNKNVNPVHKEFVCSILMKALEKWKWYIVENSTNQSH